MAREQSPQPGKVKGEMDNSFSQLEERVLKAVQLIQDLKAENRQLQQLKQELEARCENLQEDHDRMHHQLEEARQSAATLEQFEEKRRQIEEKVGGLLEKLEEIG